MKGGQMTTSEQIWFVVALGGFVILLEASITLIVKLILRSRTSSYKEKMREDIIEGIAKSIAGAIIFIIALVKLFTLPPT
jgi:hypothetical protein